MSSLTDQIAGIIADLPRGVARECGAHVNVWRLDDPPAFAPGRRAALDALATARAALVQAMCTAPGNAYVLHGDDPIDDEVPGHWIATGDSEWQLPRGLDVHDVRTSHWLSYGGWLMYAAAGCVQTDWPDVFDCSPPDLLEWMRECQVTAVIASFFDNAEWVVAVAAGADTGAVVRGRAE